MGIRRNFVVSLFSTPLMGCVLIRSLDYIICSTMAKVLNDTIVMSHNLKLYCDPSGDKKRKTIYSHTLDVLPSSLSIHFSSFKLNANSNKNAFVKFRRRQTAYKGKGIPFYQSTVGWSSVRSSSCFTLGFTYDTRYKQMFTYNT